MIGLWSTDFSEITGQGLLTRRVVEHVITHLGTNKKYVFLASGRPKAIFTWASACLGLWRDISMGRLKTLYIVCSRSNFGFLRDFPALIAARFGVRVVVHSHGSDIVELLRERRISCLARFAYSACEVIVPSRHLVAPLEGLVKSVAVCEGFFSGMGPLAHAPETKQPHLRILWNSNIMASKGFFDLIHAMEKLRSEKLQVELISLGAPIGDEEMSHQKVSEAFSEARKKPWLKYLGRVSHDLAIEVLKEIDVVALPSRYSSESQGIAVVEGMCAGKALLVSDIPALRETVKRYPAELVPPHSVQDIYVALKRIFDEKAKSPIAFHERRLGPAAEARKRFSTARFDRELLEILNDAE